MPNFSFVQKATAAGGPSSQTFGSAVAAGNCIIVVAILGGTSVTDSLGNTYVLIQSNPAGNIFAAINVLGGACTVTASPSGGAVTAYEYHSANPTYSVAPGCSNLNSYSSSILNNIQNPGSSLFETPDECMLLFVAWQNGTVGGFSLPFATMRYNGTIPQSGTSVAGFGELDIPAGISGSTNWSPLVTSIGAPPSNSWAVFLNLTSSVLRISCGSPPAGVVGSPYSHLFPHANGTGPFTFAITVGTLPTGLSLNTSTGAVTGTPATAGLFPFTIQVTDSLSATDSVACSISITGAGNWIIQEVTAEFIPSKDPLEPGAGHYRYTVRCINQAQAGTYLGFWEALGGGGGGIGSGGSSTVTNNPPAAPPGPNPGPESVARNGTVVASEPEINFIEGTNVTIGAADDPTNGKVDVTINSAEQVLKNGSAVGTRPKLNFIEGTNVTLGVVDDPGGNKVDITINSSGGGGGGTYATLQKYTQSWSAQTSVTVSHNLGTLNVLFQVYDGSGILTEPQTATIIDANTVALTFGASFTGSIVVLGMVTRAVSNVYTTSWSAQTSVTVTHNLQSFNVVVQVFDGSGLEVIPQTITINTANQITLTFGASFTGSVIVAAIAPRGLQSYSTSWTAQTSIVITHNLGSTAVIVDVFDSAGLKVEPQAVTVLTSNTVQLDFGAAFDGSVTVLG